MIALFRRIILPFVAFLAAINVAEAQNYDHSLGIRLGYGDENLAGGITYKYLASELVGLEGILGANEKGFLATGLLEIHKPIGDVQGMYWFFGGGGHVGLLEGVDNKAQFTMGLDGIVALEYHFIKELDIPIALTLDWKPSWNLLGEKSWWWDDFNLSVRYTW
jgi:hypothetical protein